MPTLKISLPNDFNAAAREAAMIDAIYGGDVEACAANGGSDALESIAMCARRCGLKFVRSTDFGGEWSGSPAQIEECRASLPEWAEVGEV